MVASCATKSTEIVKEKPVGAFEFESVGKVKTGWSNHIALIIVEGHKYIQAYTNSYDGGVAIIHAQSCDCLKGN